MTVVQPRPETGEIQVLGADGKTEHLYRPASRATRLLKCDGCKADKDYTHVGDIEPKAPAVKPSQEQLP